MSILLFSTHNANKVLEIQPLLPENLEVKTLTDMEYFDEIPETALTIEGNARLKADFVHKYFGLDCFADDTGLEVECLSGEPGVFSARYAGPQKNAHDNNQKLLEAMKNSTNRNAQFKTVIGLYFQNEYHEFTGIIKGKILTELVGTGGFGYDPLFVPDGYESTFAMMTLEEKAKISHRGLAMQQLISFINQQKI